MTFKEYAARDFYSSAGHILEGYLSSKESFNGILFLLKEPNSEGKLCQYSTFSTSMISLSGNMQR